MKKKFFLIIVTLVLFICVTWAQSSELKEVTPATANVSENRLIRIDKMIQQGIDSGWIAGAQTKAITSVAVMMLYEEGKFLLDDPISKYIPEFANPRVLDKFNEKDTTYTTIKANRDVTIRDLLTHT